jgi:hypothetical protein
MEPKLEKLNPALKLKLSQISDNPDAVRIGVIGKCSSDINGSLKEELVKTGAGIHSVIKNIFTAEASAEAINRLSNLEFVESLELSQKNELK